MHDLAFRHGTSCLTALALAARGATLAHHGFGTFAMNEYVEVIGARDALGDDAAPLRLDAGGVPEGQRTTPYDPESCGLLYSLFVRPRARRHTFRNQRAPEK